MDMLKKGIRHGLLNGKGVKNKMKIDNGFYENEMPKRIYQYLEETNEDTLLEISHDFYDWLIIRTIRFMYIYNDEVYRSKE